MTPFQRRRNPSINRMIQDMQIRNFAASTIDSYTWHVDKFCQHFGKTPEELGLEEIRQYQIYLVNEKRASWSTFNQAVCGLRFLYEVTLGKPWAIQHIPFGKRPKRLPVVLSDQEASRLIQCTENPKHRTVLLTCYAVGLRLAEATHLKVADVDGQRAQIRITSGKGNKERPTKRRPAVRCPPASPRLLDALREYWKLRRPNNYLFPGKTPDVPLSSATIQKACRLSAALAGIKNLVTPHTLRHSYATSMLEAGVDVLTISKLLGHSSFVTTMIYLHVRRQHFERSPSPIDWLPVRQCPQWTERMPESTTSHVADSQTQTDANTSPTVTPPSAVAETSPPSTETQQPPKAQRRSSGRRPRAKRNRRRE
ncbi:MAG: site-specific integrase [Planctomycetaceae bacterium]|nr:site-specific integrase [Planctomycetaceae bacterium]MCB9921998.1 site-specific integrase [Planctomycetaceae bacterium]MCB9922539.1 site-specific integrase [Planctomycetaceae bacterium]MCB9925887.1 site-specific integrase [Planctomycetaceae bacterium]